MFKPKSVNIQCENIILGRSTIECTEKINLTASRAITMEAGAWIKFHGHTMTISAPCEAKSIISIDDHTLQVTDLAGVAHNYDMNFDVSYPS